MKCDLIAVCSMTFVAISLVGCGGEKQSRTVTAHHEQEPAAPTPGEARDRPPQQYDALSVKDTMDNRPPFEYDVLSVEEMMHDWGPQVVVNLETTNDVAKKATEDDLRELWRQLAPTLGDRRVFLRLKTPVPGAAPWAVITRLNMDGEWEVDITIHEYGIDAEPYCFVNQIDRAVPNEAAMIVTLPAVNWLNEELVRLGWEVKLRKEDFFKAELRSLIQSVSVTLTPEEIYIYAFRAEGNTFIDTVDLIFSEFGIAHEVKNKLYSVIGGPEYLRVAPGEPARWSWKIGEIRVTYIRLPGIDDISAIYSR